MSVMAASNPRFGMQHLTVVPTNFEPTNEDDAELDSEADSVDGDEGDSE